MEDAKKTLLKYLNEYARYCPACGPTTDKRIKKEGKKLKSPLNTRQIYPASAIRECIRCHLRFRVTWTSFFNSVRYQILNSTVDLVDKKRELDKIDYIEKESGIHIIRTANNLKKWQDRKKAREIKKVQPMIPMNLSESELKAKKNWEGVFPGLTMDEIDEKLHPKKTPRYEE
jgi:hypothetical protein